MRAPEIAAALEHNGIISDDRVFLAAAYLTQNFRRMQAGEYQFPAHSSMAEVMELIVAGKAFLYKVTLPEGWTTAQFVERLNARAELSGAVPDAIGEGALLPATYGFRRGAARREIIEDMRAARDKLLADLWDKRASGLPFETKEQALILASIVEKETGVPEERPRVAAVFLNRLREGMRLQSDPTVVYGITLGKRKLDRPILKEDVEAKNSYNTYQISGLPPTPIANPGREAIVAVLNPIDTGELYFVADGTGGHIFAKTLAEHNRNVAKWRVIEKAERDKEEAAPENSSNAGEAALAPSQGAVQAPLATIESTEPTTDGSGRAEPVAVTPAAPAQPAPVAAPEPEVFQPGSVVKQAGKMIPIPAPRPKLQ
ncbi:MAG: endolytic transglycosylase MltG [Pseudomonadota bacterium]|nr:endolytic transglycosylase MltG [Pseudomonadota bacterium]